VGQKFEVVARGSFDYIQIPWYGLLAGVSQAENSEPGYGQGAVGYGKRFGAYADSGGHQFNYSEIFGSGISAGISTYSYHPKGDRTLSNAASVWGAQLGYDSITILVKEFWPDIRRKLSKKK
jgi:hypothetical protein